MTTTSMRRRADADRLCDSGRIQAIEQSARRGARNFRFWPVTAAPIASPADQLAVQLARAKRLLADATAAIDTAMRMVSNTAAVNGPTPAGEHVAGAEMAAT